jgi:hypothetical protein
MFSIHTICDLSVLTVNNESGLFQVAPEELVSDKFVFIENKYNRKIFYYYYGNNSLMSLIIENNIITQKSFYLTGFFNSHSFRDNDLPTDISFDSKGKVILKSWRLGLKYHRDNYLKATSVKFVDDIITFTYTNSDNEKIYISYITYSKKKSIIVDCNINFYGKTLNLKSTLIEFPHFLEAKEIDCFDLSTKILTTDILNIKKILKY